MQIKRLRDIAINASHAVSLVILLVIAAAAGFILETEKESLLESARNRAEVFSKRSAAALFPKKDAFALHFLVNTVMLEKMLVYASVTDQSGLILSHSDPERIGETDGSPQGLAARGAKAPLELTCHGGDGLKYYYFSSPIMVGARRLGTAAVAISSDSLGRQMAATRRQIVFVFLAALAAMLLLGQLRALQRAERRGAALKSAMVHTVSHEFNNALTAIDAAVFLLEEGEAGELSEQRRELYWVLDAERKSLRRYVQNILNEGRMEAGRFKLQKAPLALRDLVAAVTRTMEGLMGQKKLKFSLEMPEAPVMVSADKEAVSLVVSNLLGNAVKYTPQGGGISVRLAPDAEKKGYVTFYAENDGPGLKPEELARLKESFYRTEDGKAAASGFGLGLRISNEMLALHGGELSIKSVPGKNSCFYFSLPIIRPETGRA